MSEELRNIAERLASNVAKNGTENGQMKITLSGFYYSKYRTYDIVYRINDSVCSLGLAEIETSTRDVFEDCREPHRLAIVELDRILKTHYRAEKLLQRAMTCSDNAELVREIEALLAVRGSES